MKQTEVGLIPDDWEVKKLETIALTASGGTPLRSNKSFYTGNVRWFTTSELKDCFLNDSNEHISQEAVFSSSAKIFPKQTLLMAMYGATIGRLGILNYSAATNQACCAIIPEHDDVLYLYYYLLHNRESIVAMGCGAGQPNISQEIIKNLLISLPPLEEQQRIAKSLSDVDALIFTTEKLLQKKRNIKQGAMQNLLTGKKRLPGFAKSNNTKMTELGEIPEDWEVKTLNEFIDDFIVPMRDKPTDLTGPIPWCRIEDFDGKYLSESKTNQGVSLETIKKMNLKIFPLNTLLVSCSANLGKCAIVSKELITNQTFIGLVPNKTVNVEYLFYKMSFEESRLNEMATGTTISYLSREQFEKYEITTPPTKEEQSAIAKVLSSMDKEIETLNTKLEKYRNLKTAMMQQLLTGKIRLG
mgnify:CR=1 FL=1